MTALSLVVAAVMAAISLLRWMRVSQREHYLPGAARATAQRWLKVRPPNLVAYGVWVALWAFSIFFNISHPAVATSLGIAGAVFAAGYPVGMPLLGDPKLRFTRRASVQAAIAAVICAVMVGFFSSVLDPAPVTAWAPAFALGSVDAAAWINRPFEKRIAGKFKKQADEKLRRIRPRVVAITGSYGKTTVKNHVRDLVSGSFDTFATPASWNNVAGLSRAINERMPPTTEVFVAEMGTYGPGEIAEMVAWLQPEVAVMTAIGPVHLERMGSLERITEAKSEILAGAVAAVLNVDSPHLRQLADGLSQQVWRVGTDPKDKSVDILVRQQDSTLVVELKGQQLGEIPRGALHAGNVACAVGAAAALGVDQRVLAAGLSKLAGTASRLAVATAEDGVTVVDDTFNSNPAGAEAALATLTEAVPNGRRYVVTPGMVELGPMQHEENQRFAEAVEASGAELVIVGWTNRAALRAGFPNAATVGNREAARVWLRDHLTTGDGVLWENDLPDHYP